MKQYDFLVVGSGLFGATIAYLLKKRGKKVLIVERRNHVGGNVYTENKEGIVVHKYGAHIFHTDKKEIWDFVNQFANFNHYINSPIARYHEETYNLPFNMNTFSKLWKDVFTPKEAEERINKEREAKYVKDPQNLEEQAINLVGETVYHKLIEGYTEKQWGRSCKDLPSFIIKRLPVRLTYDNNYFTDPYQGIPVGGYTQIIEKMIEGCSLLLNTDFLKDREHLLSLADKVIYTGPLDAFFSYRFGELEYRSLRFEEKIYNEKNHQGVAVINYTDKETPYTRSIEHKHFEFDVSSPKTIVSYEYPLTWKRGEEAYYAVNDEKNKKLFEAYETLKKDVPNVYFGGRLADYRYYDMDDTILAAIKLFNSIKDN